MKLKECGVKNNLKMSQTGSDKNNESKEICQPWSNEKWSFIKIKFNGTSKQNVERARIGGII